jgi:hypothetical protein
MKVSIIENTGKVIERPKKGTKKLGVGAKERRTEGGFERVKAENCPFLRW